MESEILLPGEGLVPVSAAPHPFSTEYKFAELPAGLSIAEMIVETQPDPYLRRFAHVFIGDSYIAPGYWHTVRPKAGAMVSIRMVPQGGGSGGKNPLRTVLLIAVLVVAAVVTGGAIGALVPALAGTLGAGTIGAAVAGAAVAASGPIFVGTEAPRRPA